MKPLAAVFSKSKKAHLFEEEIVKADFYHDLGPNKKAASEILASVNLFVKNKAERNLLKVRSKIYQT